MDNLNWKESPDGVTFEVRVVPRARRNEIAGVEGGVLKVRLNAPPVEGKANAALVKLFADALGVRRADVEILRGANARHKTLRVRGTRGSKLEAILVE